MSTPEPTVGGGIMPFSLFVVFAKTWQLLDPNFPPDGVAGATESDFFTFFIDP